VRWSFCTVCTAAGIGPDWTRELRHTFVSPTSDSDVAAREIARLVGKPAPASGVVVQILVPEGATVDVGTVLALIGDRAEAAAAYVPANGPTAARVFGGVTAARSGASAELAEPAVTASPRHRHSPRVRRLSRENGVDADALVGTGHAGRVTRADVLHAAAGFRLGSAKGEPERRSGSSVMSEVRQRADQPEAPMGVAAGQASKRGSEDATPVATGMSAPGQVIGHTQVIEVDMTRLLARAGADGQRMRGMLPATPLVAKAVLESLQAHPLLNVSITSDGRIVRHARQDLAVAFDTSDGPFFQVLHDVGGLNLTGLERRLNELAEPALSGLPVPSEVTGGSFALSNAAGQGVLWDTPVLYGPQVAVLSVGTPVDRPIVVHGTGAEVAVAIRSVAYLALTHDHRAIRSADAAEFLATVKAKLEAGRFR